MATPSVSGMQENITALRMKMLNQKLADERDRLNQPKSEDGDSVFGENVKLQQAVLRREELLERLRREELERDKLCQPRAQSAGRRRSPSPQPPPSRRSLPDLSKQPEMPYRYIAEHQVSPQGYYLPPVQIQPAQPPQPVVIQQPYLPAAGVTVPNQGGSSFGKGDFMEMMMMQNVQMHQMVMQQMMLSSLPGNVLGGGRNAPGAQGGQPAVQVRDREDKAAVHHHHYSLPLSYRAHPAYRPPVQHYTLPPIDMRARYYPERNAAGRVAKMKPKVEAKAVKRITRPYPFPGNRHIRKLRHLFYATWFIKILQALAKKNKGGRPNTVFLFGLTLKEIVAAIHRLYLNPEGSIFRIIQTLLAKDALDLTQLVTPKAGGDSEKVLLKEFQYATENIVYHITEIMPKTGVLGTHKKAGVCEMIKNGQRYPDGYFWAVEMDKLQFNESARTVNVGDDQAFLLLTGIYISRSMVSTLLLNPDDYGLQSGDLTPTAEGNLKMLSTILIFLVRKVAVSPATPPMGVPDKLARFLFSDQDMQNVLVKMKKVLDSAEVSLREWGREYVRRLRVAAVSTHRV